MIANVVWLSAYDDFMFKSLKTNIISCLKISRYSINFFTGTVICYFIIKMSFFCKSYFGL